MGSIVTNERSAYILDGAELISEDREMASHWASAHINNNAAYRWVVGKYVEADSPNSNNQMWSLSDLETARTSIQHSPMNILHHQNHIVGTFIGTDMMYPTKAQAQEGITNPYVEAIGVFWRYYFPNELAAVEKYHKEGSLFFSMECVAESITFRAKDGTSQEFDYEGPQSPSYGSWGEDKSATRQLNKPHFLGGALIFPPARPGWAGAEVKELSSKVKQHSDEAEAAYETFKEHAPHLKPEVWEELMLTVMQHLHTKEPQSL